VGSSGVSRLTVEEVRTSLSDPPLNGPSKMEAVPHSHEKAFERLQLGCSELKRMRAGPDPIPAEG
jgi:hypothetical protein